jgi:hypothetical protein
MNKDDLTQEELNALVILPFVWAAKMIELNLAFMEDLGLGTIEDIVEYVKRERGQK